MQAKKDFVPVDQSDIGLGRAPFDHDGQILFVKKELPSSLRASDEAVPSHSISSGRSFGERKHQAARKMRKVLHISQDSDSGPETQHDPTSSILAESFTETSSSRLEHDLPTAHKRTKKEILHNPVDTVKDTISGQGSQQAAVNLAVQEVSHGQQVDLINAYDRVQNAETDAEKLLAEQDLDRLIKARQTLYVRWTVDRHVSKCRVLPRETFVSKGRSAFETKNNRGERVVDWKAYWTHQLEYYAQQYGGQYIGYGSNPPAPSKESIMPNVERVIIASAPLQELVMTARCIYRWEDTSDTLKCLIIYVILWHFNLLLPGALSVIVYLVVRRHYTGETIEDIRVEIKRTEDVHRTALSLTEYIEKEGNEVWAEKILQAMGPWLMVQLCDAANSFEVMRNFYEWRVPSRTMATLGILLAAILFTTFAPAWLLIKFITFSTGLAFFGLFPLATNFPDYRLLASVPKRMFWNIPTHAEWAFKALQAEGSRFYHTTQPDVEFPENVDYGFYNAHYNHDKGRLIISANSVRFETNIGHRVLWTMTYRQINNVEKEVRQVSKTMPSSDSGMDLRLVSKTSDERMLVDVENRDQAFSQIIGFSDTTWQIVW